MDKLVENLKKKGYMVSVFESKKTAVEYMSGKINGTTVGIGGSITVQEMGLFEKLADKNTVYWHWKQYPGLTADDIRRKAAAAKIYISSVNGISQDGQIINIDGNGNRVASTIFGHEKVYFVIGQNKISPDFEKALWRARNIAAPLNTKRLGVKTPCAVKGDKCYDCVSPQRICNTINVLSGKPSGCKEYEVVLIKENLGY